MMSDLANRSRSLIWHERPERFAHRSKFVLSNLSDSLTVAHLSWAIWANRSQSLIWFEQISEWAMSKWANSQPWSVLWKNVHIIYFSLAIFARIHKNSFILIGKWACLIIKTFKNHIFDTLLSIILRGNKSIKQKTNAVVYIHWESLLEAITE